MTEDSINNSATYLDTGDSVLRGFRFPDDRTKPDGTKLLSLSIASRRILLRPAWPTVTSSHLH